MRIDYPRQEQIPLLKSLWRQAFGDEDAFLDAFFGDVFAPDRCRCVTEGSEVTAALYWLDCALEDRPMAYLYAVATAKKYRGRGHCRALMADTHKLLQELGYAGAILVPGEPGLFQMYRGMGYEVCSRVRQWTCGPADRAMALREVDGAEYARLRRQYLPAGGVVQERENLALLQVTARLYAGEQVLLCAAGAPTGNLVCAEFLGDPAAAGQVLAALQCRRGTFRGPGNDRDFAMYRPFSPGKAPEYFGLAFD